MKKEVLDPYLLQKARDAALYKLNTSMPMRNETSDVHVSRCWAEAFLDVGLFIKKSEE